MTTLRGGGLGPRISRLAGVAGALLAGYGGFLLVEGSRRLVRPERRPFEPLEGDPLTPAEIGLSYEDLRFTADDGVTLSGWLVPARRETRAAVILMHGFSWNRLPWLAGFVPWLVERYHVLQFDFRGHGQSEDASVTLGNTERMDVAAAVRLLTERGFGPIALMGVSMGASAAIMAAPDLPVSAVIADAAYADLVNPIGNSIRASGFPLRRLGARVVLLGASLRARSRLLSPIDRVAGIAPRGLLLISPDRDQLIDPAQARRLYAAAGEPKELYVVHGAGHSEAREVGGATYVRRVLDFLERHLDAAEPRAA